MDAAKVTPLIEPDAEAMLCHLEHLFGGDLDGCHEGKIELAWSDARDGALKHAAVFGTDQLEEVVARAIAVNRMPGQNVYVGQALRRPDIPPFGRCGDKDFLALTCFYVDIDDDVVATARISYRHRACPPTAVVVTGRHPHVRAQMLWRQETPAGDPDLCRRQNRALAAALGGDPSVVNPGRVMRLGGSIAWPIKPGRVLERTEFQTFDDGRSRFYFPGQIAKAFPPDVEAAHQPQAGSTDGADAPEPFDLHLGSALQGVSVAECLRRIRAGSHWHDNMLRLVGHWIARGWSDAEIVTTAEALTLKGWTVEQTRRDVAPMIAGGRQKWAVADSVHEIGEDQQPPPLAPAWVEDLDATTIPRRRYLLGRTFVRGQVTVRVSPPGAGKSTIAIEEAIAIATAREITGAPVHEQTKVWIYNNEDDVDEMRRRLAAVLTHWSIPVGEVRGRLAVNSGVDRPLLVAKVDRLGNIVRQPDVDACIEHIRSSGIGLFVVDPFVETHEADENANGEIKLVAAMFRDIARRGDCAVLLVHHTAKPPQGSSDGHAGNMHTARGASALVGIARVVQTLFTMGTHDAERLGVPEDDRHLHVRLDDAKANLSLVDGRPRWFRRVSVTIANGEEVGVLVAEDLEARADAPDEDDPLLDSAILEAVAQAWRDGVPLTDQPRARTRYAPTIIARAIGKSVGTIEAAIARLMAVGALRKEPFDRKRHMAGLRVVPFDERLPAAPSESPGDDGA